MPICLIWKETSGDFKHFFFNKFLKFSTIFEIFRKVLIRGRTRNALVGPFPENMKSADCWEYYYFLCLFLFLSLQAMQGDSFTSPFLAIHLKYYCVFRCLHAIIIYIQPILTKKYSYLILVKRTERKYNWIIPIF